MSSVVEVNEVIQLFTQRVGGHRRRIISVRHGFTWNTTLQVILCTAHNVKKVIYIETCHFKGIVHPKIKIVSSFTHPQVVPNLYECVCSAEHKDDILKNEGNRAVLGHH